MLHFACVRAVRCSAWIVRAAVYLACVCVCVRQSACAARLVPFVQHFVSQRGQMGLVYPTPCTVCLGSTGVVPTCPCWHSCWYLFVQCFAWSARAMYLFARGRTRTGTSCAVLRLDSTGYVPMCPCLYPCTVFVQCFAWTARAMYLLARGRTRTGISCAVLRLHITDYVPMCPCLYPCAVFCYG